MPEHHKHNPCHNQTNNTKHMYLQIIQFTDIVLN